MAAPDRRPAAGGVGERAGGGKGNGGAEGVAARWGPEAEELAELDRRDPLARFRSRFRLPEGVLYFDGNSLGPPPRTVEAALSRRVGEEWGGDLIGAWNRRGWFDLPERLGARIAPLIGAEADEVIVADSVSLNLFKLLSALLRRSPPGRRVVLSETSNFPTDLYMAEGLASLLGRERVELRLVEPEALEAALGPETAVALVTQVDFRTGRKRNLRDFTAAARAAGVPVIWDLSHSAGAFRLRLEEDGAEFAVGCGYKYLNGGPGAPAFLRVARRRQAELETPLSGWMGHARPFDFVTAYEPAPGMRRFLTGTPPILALAALEEGLRAFDGVDLDELEAKSGALGDRFVRLAEARLAGFGVTLASPREAAERGSQVSLRHPEGFAVMQALIARGVVGDFREPDLMRFGFAPLVLGYREIGAAVEALREVLAGGEYREPRFARRGAVT